MFEFLKKLWFGDELKNKKDFNIIGSNEYIEIPDINWSDIKSPLLPKKSPFGSPIILSGECMNFAEWNGNIIVEEDNKNYYFFENQRRYHEKLNEFLGK